MKDKRLLLRVIFKLMSFVGLGFVIYMLFSGFFDDENTSVIYINVSKINKGEVNYFSIENKKLLVLHRIDALKNKNPHKTSEYFIAYAYDPVYGCAIEFKGEYFKSVCIDIKYDLQGRVYENTRSARDLILPKYNFIDAYTVAVEIN
jgi:hypothetical protein